MGCDLVSTFLALGLAIMGLAFVSIFLSLELVIRGLDLILILTLGWATTGLQFVPFIGLFVGIHHHFWLSGCQQSDWALLSFFQLCLQYFCFVVGNSGFGIPLQWLRSCQKFLYT
jgi:hypothetical protein